VWSQHVPNIRSWEYKALVWQDGDTPVMFISDVFDWDANSAVLRDVPMLEGGIYSLNVAVYFGEGYAYSEYVIFEWSSVVAK